MKQLWKKILFGLGIFLILPLGITAGISGRDALMGKQKINLEKVLPIILCQQIDWDYEEEALKAQAVLARSSLSLCVKKGEMNRMAWRTLMEDYQSKKGQERYQQAYEKMQMAVDATMGQVLFYENMICEGVFHKVSSGYTREGKEILMDTSYAYLTGIKSEMDIYAKDYLHGHYFSEEALKVRMNMYYPDIVWNSESIVKQIQIVERDASDYVTRIKLGNVVVSGEEFRVNLELSSANFTIQEIGGKVRFLCKGLGHGFGMSQFGANEMAKKGNTYLKILEYYFPHATVQKINLEI